MFVFLGGSMKNPFKDLTRFEMILWISSIIVVTVSFILSPQKSVFSIIASLIGVTALIFIAKGYVFGQILLCVFATSYGIISFFNQYYGEVITYLCMSAPSAVMAIISWLKHPYKETKQVEVNKKLSAKQIIIILALTSAVTAAFYFILKALGNASLELSTLSVFTSFLAASLTFMRSPFYGLGYAANDLVLIALWIIASVKDSSNIPMIFCFVMFFANDTYGFINWRRMKKQQNNSAEL